ncbi:Uncharacterized protein DAT39_003127, partial [Clarias magur]
SSDLLWEASWRLARNTQGLSENEGLKGMHLGFYVFSICVSVHWECGNLSETLSGHCGVM